MASILQRPSRDQIAAFGSSGRMRLLQTLAQAQQEVFASTLDVLDVMEAEGDHVADGHRSVKQLVVALTNDDPSAVNAKVRAMKTLRQLPEVRERLGAGEFGSRR
jgi:transcription termination factor Rho